MIFAAGLGTRLRPLTDNIPKALLKIGNVTLLEYVILKLLKYGFDDIIINLHHFGNQIKDYLIDNNYFGARVTFSDESDLLLNTGGGLKKSAHFFDDGKPFIVYNCDVITDLNLTEFYKISIEKNTIASIAVRDRETSRYFLFDKDLQLSGWINKSTGDKKIVKGTLDNLIPLAFSGIHTINPSIFKLFPEQNVFSITDFYVDICDRYKISGIDHSSTEWIDIGKKETLMMMQGTNLIDFL